MAGQDQADTADMLHQGGPSLFRSSAPALEVKPLFRNGLRIGFQEVEANFVLHTISSTV